MDHELDYIIARKEHFYSDIGDHTYYGDTRRVFTITKDENWAVRPKKTDSVLEKYDSDKFRWEWSL